jgi:chemotaxis protein CheZ
VTSTPDQLAQSTQGSLQDSIQEGIKAEIAPLFDELRRFTDRRIAELSSEIHATVQLFDFGEANLSGQLGKIQEQVAAMVAMPAAATRNSGLELEAVVQATETAANQIMEAAEAIGDWLRTGTRDVASIEEIATKLNSIFEACSFQDVTGQRIRRAIQHLQHVETMLTEVMPHGEAAAPKQRAVMKPDLVQDDVDRVFALAMRMGESGAQGDASALPGMSLDDLDQMISNVPALPGDVAVAPALAQDDIDNMFGAPSAPPVSPGGAAEAQALAQDDIDSMFGASPAARALPNGASGASALAQDDIDNMFAAAKAAAKLPDDPPGKPELGQDDVDRMFG